MFKLHASRKILVIVKLIFYFELASHIIHHLHPISPTNIIGGVWLKEGLLDTLAYLFF